MASGPQTSNGRVEEAPLKDFESALEACGFGKFNYCLLIVSMLAVAATVFETSNISYILPTAECDLQIGLLSKGVLNAITYAGMIISAVPWGYLADTTGRKHVLMYGLLIGSLMDMGCACSQTAIQLIVFKFLAGFINCGPLAVVLTYLSEFHIKKHRSRVLMILGMIKTIDLLILPAIATATLPHHIAFEIWVMKFHTWHVFLAITALPGLISGLVLPFFPESPKYLMAQGRNVEALATFKTIYALNTGKSKESYPVIALFEEAPEKAAKIAAKTDKEQEATNPLSKQQTAKETFKDGLKQLKPMFSSPYLKFCFMVYLMGFSILLGQNSVRLWLPQLFASIVEYEQLYGSTTSMCTILEYNVNRTHLIKNVDEMKTCDVHISFESYTNNIAVSGCTVFGFFLVSFIINKIGNKTVLSRKNGALLTSFIFAVSFYWSLSEYSTLAISAIFVTASSIAGTTVISVSVNLFPTVMRAMVVVLVLTSGRLGSLLGNVLFPLFMTMGCIPPFVMIGGAVFCACIISFFVPGANSETFK
ncbi:synaptic vesicle glycoprotein 2B isoform X2 [Bactrocera dorsalis]|uniref:Synaptic vesicle glycoprotein 2B isoform X2 n=1 Tax=Bactrocera dorsalis TaxID=27457 RepID=A0A6I9VJZ7_BACDO|nr:synaptic vesicle glycoprotein 2B isoform X2 [Bactrocera dorsalis]XP_011203933.1 synaptic vesicle glycoprotein 2B isoform X2 [Bactrocera dorsalis]